MGNKVVYIAGAGHSGSTLLTLLLSNHPSMVGLGEIHQVLRESHKSGMEYPKTKAARCSCGNSIDTCSLWKAIADEAKGKNITSYVDRYRLMVDTVKAQYGVDAIPVDSSKHVPFLRELLQVRDSIDFRVIHLVRDVRSYLVSRVDLTKAYKAKGRPIAPAGKNPLLKLWMNYPSYHYVDWYHVQRKVEGFLRENRIPSFRVGYEELCLSPAAMMEKICAFLEVSYSPDMVSALDTSAGHVLRGNRMRHRSGNTKVMYDNRWFYRREWFLPSLVFPHITRYNRTSVYGNTAGTWEKLRVEPIRTK
jgi:hypothetical protein